MTPTDTVRPIRRALISVYDKTGLLDLAAALTGAGVGAAGAEFVQQIAGRDGPIGEADHALSPR